MTFCCREQGETAKPRLRRSREFLACRGQNPRPTSPSLRGGLSHL